MKNRGEEERREKKKNDDDVYKRLDGILMARILRTDGASKI
jgi:hypothetical protein